MKKVYSARDEVDAHLVQGVLSEQGIESVVQSEGLSSITGVLQSSEEAAPSIWVSDEDEQKALESLQRVKEGELPGGGDIAPDWTCPNCGESIEGQFSECWNCGTTRPDPAPDPAA